MATPVTGQAELAELEEMEDGNLAVPTPASTAGTQSAGNAATQASSWTSLLSNQETAAQKAGNTAAATTDASDVATVLEGEGDSAATAAADSKTPASVPGAAAGGGTAPASTGPTATDTQIIAQALASVGLGGMASWATSTLTSLMGSGMSFADAENYVETNLNNPQNVNAQGVSTGVDTAALGVFNSVFPGFNARIAAGYGNGDVGDTNPLGALAAYINYSSQIQSMGVQAGLTAGTITADTIGNAWAGDVSTTEMSDRITTGYVAAASAPAQVQEALNTYFGVTTGDLASYYLNPSNTLQTLQQNFNTASVGAAATLSGFSPSLGEAQASSLAAFLASGNQSGLAGGSVNEAQAQSAFTSGLGNGMASASQMAQAGFENQLPGTAANSPDQVTQAQLLGGIEGDANALASLRLATGTRTASTGGGGGFASNVGGVQGVGYGSEE